MDLEKLQLIVNHIYENYNHRLLCDGCGVKFIPRNKQDHGAFTRDVGASTSQFRCKWKTQSRVPGVPKCQKTFSQTTFYTLAMTQLNPQTAQAIRMKFAIQTPDPFLKLEPPPPGPPAFTKKRTFALGHSGLTPESKRRWSAGESEPSSPTIDKTVRLESQVKALTERLSEKEDFIQTLKQQIQLLKSMQIAPPGSPLPNSDLFEPTPPPLQNSDLFEPTPPPLPETPPQTKDTSKLGPILSGQETIVQRRFLEKKYRLSLVYFMNFGEFKTITEFRRLLLSKGFDKNSIKNISFVGPTVIEVVVDLAQISIEAFLHHADGSGFILDPQLDPLENSIENPVWLAYGTTGSHVHDTVKRRFVKRVRQEIKTCNDPRVKSLYTEWFKALGWTSDVSPAKDPDP